MNKKKITIFSLLVFLFAFSFNSGVVNALITNKPDGKVNTFTVAEFKEVTYTYYYVDEDDNEVQAQNSTTSSVLAGTEVTINNALSNMDCSSIKHYVNGVLYNSNTYTVNDDTTIKEVCELNRYTITYNLDGGTLNNPKTTYTIMTPTFNLPTPTKTNYTFNGWTGSNGTTAQTSVTISQGSTGNKTYTANWQNATFTVSYIGDTSTYSYTGELTATAGGQYTTTITLNNNYNIDSHIIRMGGVRLTQGTEYTYSQNTATRSATITINNVTADIEIDVQTQWQLCLAEGTEVMLWDGSYKKIEDITYNDLLRVWNHDTGTYGYEYAAWIEQAGTSDAYTKITFSDGSELKVVGNHSIFSKTLNRYVDVNSDEFNVGDEVVNLKDGISYVTVASIEQVEESIRYYHVISSRYFNLITNNILTTYEIYNNISNFMGFDRNLKWQIADIVREDLYTYEDFSFLDHYLFKVFRLGELKYLVKNRMITQEEMDDLFNNYLMDNDKKVIPPRDKNGNYLWMVTTSDDINPSDKSHQMVEGSTYVVPVPENEEGFKYWYNHSDNKYYQPGDIIEVDSSMYLEAIYGRSKGAEKLKEKVEKAEEEQPEEETPIEPVFDEIIMDPINDDPEEE